MKEGLQPLPEHVAESREWRRVSLPSPSARSTPLLVPHAGCTQRGSQATWEPHQSSPEGLVMGEQVEANAGVAVRLQLARGLAHVSSCSSSWQPMSPVSLPGAWEGVSYIPVPP